MDWGTPDNTSPETQLLQCQTDGEVYAYKKGTMSVNVTHKVRKRVLFV